jgi:hypothetical protein
VHQAGHLPEKNFSQKTLNLREYLGESNCKHVARNRPAACSYGSRKGHLNAAQGGTFLGTVSDHPLFHKETDPWSYSFSYTSGHNGYQPRIMISYCKVPYVV